MPPFKKPSLIVFDLDGTLVDTFRDIACAANHALEKLKRPAVPVERVIPLVGGGGRNLMIKCMAPYRPTDHEVDIAFNAWRSYYGAHLCDFSRPYPGALKALLDFRHHGTKTAVLSNKWHFLTQGIITQLGMTPMLDAVQGQEPSRPLKPNPTMLLEIMERFDAAPATTWMVGDGDADVLVARNAGINFVGVTWGVSKPENLRELGAETLVDSFDELKALFL